MHVYPEPVSVCRIPPRVNPRSVSHQTDAKQNKQTNYTYMTRMYIYTSYITRIYMHIYP